MKKFCLHSNGNKISINCIEFSKRVCCDEQHYYGNGSMKWKTVQIHFHKTKELTMFVKMCSKYYLYDSWICEF